MSKPKKKPSKTRGTPAQFVPGLMRDARASVSLDGETQSANVRANFDAAGICAACGHPLAGECPDSPLTKAVVEAALGFCRGDVLGPGLQAACRALRAARGK